MLAASAWLFRPLVAGGRALGAFGIARADGGDPVRPDQLPLLAGFIDQAALALERINLVAEMAEVSQLKERDRLRAALLSSLSHDLRSPLTTILAAAGQIRAAHCEGLDPALADGLLAEAERLDRFLANLLGMARVEAGALLLRREAVDLTDAVGAAVHDLRNRLGDHPIRLDVPVDLPLVLADPQLLHHILINLLDNAGKYSDPGGAIAIRGTQAAGVLTLAVVDEGPGLPRGREADLFETFARLEGSDRKGGTGLGLAIVKGFAEAMGMNVSAANRDDGKGAIVSLQFPEALIVRSSGEEAE
jgi:two-component system sensor histidine kinase KdpD